jgi:hypothetical protein
MIPSRLSVVPDQRPRAKAKHCFTAQPLWMPADAEVPPGPPGNRQPRNEGRRGCPVATSELMHGNAGSFGLISDGRPACFPQERDGRCACDPSRSIRVFALCFSREPRSVGAGRRQGLRRRVMRLVFMGHSMRVRVVAGQSRNGVAGPIDRGCLDASPPRAKRALGWLAVRQNAAPRSGGGRSRQDRRVMADRRSRRRWVMLERRRRRATTANGTQLERA